MLLAAQSLVIDVVIVPEPEARDCNQRGPGNEKTLTDEVEAVCSICPRTVAYP